MPEVVAIGAANADLIAKVERFPKPDDEVNVKQLGMYGGGSAANVAVGVSRLGHSAGFIGIVGTDQFGDFLVKEFEKDNIDISQIKRLDGSSSTAICVVDKTGERMILPYEGMAEMFDKSLINENYLKGSKFLHLTSIEGKHVLEAFELAAKKAKKLGIKVILDPGCIFAEKGLNALKPILQNCFAVLPNRVEANHLTGSDKEEAAKKILETCVENVIITRGMEGCMLANKEGVKRIPFAPRTKREKAVDLTGCGDAFAAGLITALLENKSLEEAIEFGMQVGYIAAQKTGARSTPKREELPEEIRI